MSRGQAVSGLWRTCAIGLILAGTAAVGLSVPSGARADTAKPADPVVISQADSDRESALVAGEDRRLQDVATVSTLARWQNRAQRAPYRLGTPEGYTLVLTPRTNPYTLSDLLQLEPQTLLELSDGSYLLDEHIVVLAGAELNLSSPSGLTLRLASSPTGFVSIVSMGGRLIVVGTAEHPVKIISWNPRTAAPDTVTNDGRAYLRAVGGQVQLSYTNLSDLGFWSGRTGGLSLTGTDRPNTGSITSSEARRLTSAPSLPGTVGSVEVLPTGKLPAQASKLSDADPFSGLSYVSARIDHTVVTGDAFGLFATGADGVAIDSSQFLDSQISGVDFHRYVQSSVIERTVSNNSGGDGFSLGRATQGIQISQSTAVGNALDGFAISGAPLADGPSAVGSPTESYGNISLANSTADANGHDGIHLQDGFNMTITGNHVSNSQMGIVASDTAHNVSISANQISGISSHGIAVLDGVTASQIDGNVVTGTGIYLRDSSAQVQGNTVLKGRDHGIELVGAAGGTVVANNSLSGRGPSAVSKARASGSISVHNNADNGWHDTTGIVTQILHALLHPMSLLWIAILMLVLLSMVKGLRQRNVERGTNPYAHQASQLARHP